jgi:predicted nucleic acid-binding protein
MEESLPFPAPDWANPHRYGLSLHYRRPGPFLTEASVSLAAMVHLGRISAAELPHHQGSLEDYWDQSIQEVELAEEVLEDARQLAQRFPLRTYDAIHLASAREARRMLRGLFDGEVQFLAFDAALLKAAEAVGFTIPS